MKGLDVPGKIGDLDWEKRGDEIKKSQVPESIIDTFRSHLKLPNQLGIDIDELIQMGFASAQFRVQKLTEAVVDYILLFSFYTTDDSLSLVVVSVEVRNGVIQQPITRRDDAKRKNLLE